MSPNLEFLKKQIAEIYEKYLHELLCEATIYRIQHEIDQILVFFQMDFNVKVEINGDSLDIKIVENNTMNVDQKTFEPIVIPNAYETMLDSFIKQYGEHKGKFITNRLAKMIRRCNDMCLDNFRIADKNDPIAVDAYEDAQSHGCCGFADDEFEYTAHGKAPTIIMLGFNYGH